MTDLVQRLRTPWTKPEHTPIEFAEAADRIEQLEEVLAEWFDKTDWVQKTSDWQELGMHRADALKQRIEQLERENAAIEKRLQEIQRMCLGYQEEHAGLRKDAERWKFTMWWQDKNPKPTHIQDELTNMHRWARQRGALAPNADELQRATDAAIDAAMMEQK